MRRDRHPSVGVVDGVEQRNPVAAELLDPDDRPVRVQRGMTTIGRDHVVHERLLGGKLPLRHHEIPLEPLWARWRLWQLAACDPIAPIREDFQRTPATKRSQRAGHERAADPDLGAVLPCVIRTVELIAHLRRDLSGDLGAHLMALGTGIGHLDVSKPRPLCLEGLRYPVVVTPRSGEIALRRRLEQRVPVVGRVVLGRRGGVRCDDRRQVDLPARDRPDFG